MKQLTILFILICLLLPGTSVIGMELSVIDPIVSTDKAPKFGLWTVYNDGANIFIIDQEGTRYIEVNVNVTSVVWDAEKGFQLFDNGTSSVRTALGTLFDDRVQLGLAAEVKGQMSNAKYIFGNRGLMVIR